MADSLADGRKIRVLTVVANFSRECVALEVATGFNGAAVAAVLTRAVHERTAPRFIRCGNGSEFVSKAVDQWAYCNKVELDFSRPRKLDRQRCLRIIQRAAARIAIEPDAGGVRSHRPETCFIDAEFFRTVWSMIRFRVKHTRLTARAGLMNVGNDKA